MSEFKATQQQEGANLVLSFEGTIDEDVSFPSVDASAANSVVIDLHGVRSINSVGIREWLNWIKPLADQKPMVLQRAPKAIVFQFNMVEGFLPKNASVTSFYVPFYCDTCDKENNVLFSVGKEVTVESGQVKLHFDMQQANICKGPDCELEMDVTESKYFQFLKRA